MVSTLVWLRYIVSARRPGKDLNEIKRRAVEVLADEVKELQGIGTRLAGTKSKSMSNDGHSNY
jgi:hypothetical protein